MFPPGVIGVNPWIGEADKFHHMKVLDDLLYVEFLPESETDSATPQAVHMGHAEIGKHYEVVTTTSSGLYRYRTNDIVCKKEIFFVCVRGVWGWVVGVVVVYWRSA